MKKIKKNLLLFCLVILLSMEEYKNQEYVLHKADTRGVADHGWLKSFHSFSFAGYYNKKRMNFGALRVLNDDTVDGGMGFPTHPHSNMEIISIPLKGDLEHKDSMGTVSVIRSGDIQVMSAGTGVRHSEYKKNKDQVTKFLQIWVQPKKSNVEPRYDQKKLKNIQNELEQILSPDPKDDGVWIHQDAWFHLGKFEKDFVTHYELKKQGNGVYLFVLEGDFIVNGIDLSRRDGIGITKTEKIHILSKTQNSRVLLMEVPMNY